MKQTLLILSLTFALGCLAPAQQVEPQAQPPAEPSATAAMVPLDEPSPTSPTESAAAPTPAPEASSPASESFATDTRIREALTGSLDYLARDGAAWMHGESPLNQDNGRSA